MKRLILVDRKINKTSDQRKSHPRPSLGACRGKGQVTGARFE